MYRDPVAVAESLAAKARAEDQTALVEADGFELLEAAGLRTPTRLFVRTAEEVVLRDTPAVPGERVVVKVVSPVILHKSERGGVEFVANDREAIAAVVRRMARRFERDEVSGFSIAECVPFDASFGGEWLLGLRWTDEFGPVITMGAGGIATEFLASALKSGREAVAFSPAGLSRRRIEEGLARLAITALATGQVRRQRARTTLGALVDVVERFTRLAPACRPDGIQEIEINPLVAAPAGLVALDVLATIGTGNNSMPLPRPVHKLRHLLTPKTFAVMGVSSTQMNPGRIILHNLLGEGIDPSTIFVIKPGAATVEGCPAVGGITLLPHKVDLLVLSVSAEQVPGALIKVTDAQKAESVVVIPGGFDEKAGGSAIVEQMTRTLAQARATDWQGPIVNGGNCLGITSRPGRCDTMFIPPHKLGREDGPVAPLALISQSGAFAVSRETWLTGIRPRYAITVGNQMDLTVGDYLQYLESDPEVKLFALYVEGFRRLDGRATADTIQRITTSGRPVIVYRAGRTPEGRRATASHTAAVAGDYTVSRDLLRAAGAIVVDSLDDFTDLVMLFTLLQDRPVGGRRLAAMSNAGYECVAIADNAGSLVLEPFDQTTVRRLERLLGKQGISAIVDVNNPLDVTPMLGDEGFAEAAAAILDDPDVDLALIGCVPATAALNTLAGGEGHTEDVSAPDALPARIAALSQQTAKPFVMVVDAGRLYDPLVDHLLRAGIPTLRSTDRALRLLDLYVEHRCANDGGAAAERWVDEFGLPQPILRSAT